MIDYSPDVRRIVLLLRARGLTISVEWARRMWDEVSSERDAGWLSLPKKDEDLWKMLRDHVIALAKAGAVVNSTAINNLMSDKQLEELGTTGE